MNSQALATAFSNLSTPLIADACLRIDCPVRPAPVGIRALVPGVRVTGRVVPARHSGSVDVFFEAMEGAQPGDVLVIDNQGRDDEGCVGDLTVLEARAAGLAAMVVWGRHRDSSELVEIGLPVFSCGAFPLGPQRLDPPDNDALDRAELGSITVGRDDAVFADDDGVLFVALDSVGDVLEAAQIIWETERRQAELVRSGTPLREQFEFERFLRDRERYPGLTFRQHLRGLGAAIEE